MSDSVKYLRDWAADMRNVSGMSVDADKLDEIATEIEANRAAIESCDIKIGSLKAQVRLMEKRAEDAEARNDFLITELDILREKARQS